MPRGTISTLGGLLEAHPLEHVYDALAAADAETAQGMLAGATVGEMRQLAARATGTNDVEGWPFLAAAAKEAGAPVPVVELDMYIERGEPTPPTAAQILGLDLTPRLSQPTRNPARAPTPAARQKSRQSRPVVTPLPRVPAGSVFSLPANGYPSEAMNPPAGETALYRGTTKDGKREYTLILLGTTKHPRRPIALKLSDVLALPPGALGDAVLAAVEIAAEEEWTS